MKTNEEIINQYLPDGGYSGLSHYNENKVLKMMEESNTSLLISFIDWAKNCGKDAFYIFDETDEAIEKFLESKL